MKYTHKIILYHTFSYEEEITTTVDADDESDALSQAEEGALDGNYPDTFEAEHDSTECLSIELISTEGGEESPVRCDKTANIFAPHEGAFK